MCFIYHSLCIHSSVVGDLSYLQLGAITNNGAMYFVFGSHVHSFGVLYKGVEELGQRYAYIQL